MDIETAPLLRSEDFPYGVCHHYSATDMGSGIILRACSTEHQDPIAGEPYIVEFCDPQTREVLEVLDPESSRPFCIDRIRSELDELAEIYLREEAEKWETYVAKSGR